MVSAAAALAPFGDEWSAGGLPECHSVVNDLAPAE